jgi:hypothetical protein
VSTDSSADSGFGTDPVFNPYSDLSTPLVHGHEADFYNTSELAAEISPYGVPFGFFQRETPGYPPGSPIIFQVFINIHPLSSRLSLSFLSLAAHCWD